MKIATDENFDGKILRGLLTRIPKLDVARVQDVGLSGPHDSVVLEWAAREERVLFTHDVRTMTAEAYNRVRASLPMWGVVEVSKDISISRAIEELSLLAECSHDGEWKSQVLFIPL